MGKQDVIDWLQDLQYELIDKVEQEHESEIDKDDVYLDYSEYDDRIRVIGEEIEILREI